MNWERERFYVRSSKTAHHEGKEGRWVPIFPELKAELETLFSKPISKGKEFVINRYRNPEQTLSGQFTAIREQAGLPEIPRPFDNMRATRSNEIYVRFGASKESAWIGHTARTRAAHYDMVTDDDYAVAAQWDVSCTQTISHPFSHR